jgi:NADH-quinone oxidoreductase subunit L
VIPTIPTLLILIPALPLVAALLTAALGKRVLRERSHLPAVVGVGLSCLLSVLLVFQVQRGAPSPQPLPENGIEPQVGYEQFARLWTWAAVADAYSPAATGATTNLRSVPGLSNRASGTAGQAGHHALHGRGIRSDARSPQSGGRAFEVEIVLRADPLTAVMLATVTFVSLLVVVYSIAYMHGDPGYWRFFSYMALFVFSMTMLVSVSNFVLLYIFWEAVGLCSYLLIGFWFHKPEAAAAGKKAFLVNRIGDCGLALAIYLLWTTYGTLNFHDAGVPGILGQKMLGHPELYAGGGLATAICLLLMLGACGKSAQFPLHVWLPDAMEGPTPVSALIHAATMVTAGVYLVARCMPLFAASTDAQHIVALVGGLTALMAALIAVTQTDLKRILAYSTISQLGYMFLALGMGTLVGTTAGMFHLFTHAFFKALLFLGAGSVMHAMGGVIDIRRLGGLRHRLPTTHWTFLFGCLALAGVFPFAGFFSKDAILAEVHHQATSGGGDAIVALLLLIALLTVFLTAFYAFRAFFVTFYGREQIPSQADAHGHRPSSVMTVPLVILAACSLLVGAYFEWTQGFARFLAGTPSLASLGTAAGDAAAAEAHQAVALWSTLLGLLGIALAAVVYLGAGGRAEWLAGAMDRIGLYQLSHGKFFIDQLYQVLVVRPLEAVAALSYWVDRWVIDGLVNLCGLLPRLIGAALRPLQNGLVQFYALAMLLGLLVLLGTLLM